MWQKLRTSVSSETMILIFFYNISKKLKPNNFIFIIKCHLSLKRKSDGYVNCIKYLWPSCRMSASSMVPRLWVSPET